MAQKNISLLKIDFKKRKLLKTTLIILEKRLKKFLYSLTIFHIFILVVPKGQRAAKSRSEQKVCTITNQPNQHSPPEVANLN